MGYTVKHTTRGSKRTPSGGNVSRAGRIYRTKAAADRALRAGRKAGHTGKLVRIVRATDTSKTVGYQIHWHRSK